MVAILITGGAGFVGSHAAKVAVEAGHDVTVLDSLQLGHRKAIPPQARFLQADLRNLSETIAAMRKAAPEVIMHFAAYSQVGESVKEPAKYYGNNVGGTANLLIAARELSIGQIIFSSTAATYGNPQGELTEEHPTEPINPYGDSKLVSERMLRSEAFSRGMRVIAFRYFNVAGADPDGTIGEHHDPETHLIPNVIRAVLGQEQKPLEIFGNDYPTPDGTCVRDYIHATDLAQAHLMGVDYLAKAKPNLGTKGGFFDVMNIGTGKGTSNLEVIRAVEAITERKVSFEFTDRRPGDPAVLVANADKIKRVLGWQPKFPNIIDSVRHATAWFKANPKRYGDMRVGGNSRGEPATNGDEKL